MRKVAMTRHSVFRYLNGYPTLVSNPPIDGIVQCDHCFHQAVVYFTSFVGLDVLNASVQMCEHCVRRWTFVLPSVEELRANKLFNIVESKYLRPQVVKAVSPCLATQLDINAAAAAGIAGIVAGYWNLG
jgi:hypothetical protein